MEKLGTKARNASLLGYACTYWIQHLQAGDWPFLTKAEYADAFPVSSTLEIECWASLRRYFPEDTPKWLYEEPSPLCVGAFYGLRHFTQHCLESGSAAHGSGFLVDQKDPSGRSLLTLAASAGQYEVVKMLLEYKPHIDMIDPIYGQSPLKYAAWAGHRDIVALLLHNGASVNDRTNGTTALAQSSACGHHEVVKTLLEHGASPDMLDLQRGQTPLALAAANAHRAVVLLLLEHEADTNKSDLRTGLTPLHHAVIAKSPEVAKVLIEHGALAKIAALSSLPGSLARWIGRIFTTFPFVADGLHECPAEGTECTRGDEWHRPTAERVGIASNSKRAKRSRSDREGQDNSDPEDEQRNKRRKEPSQGRKDKKQEYGPQFACPYAKYDVERFCNKSCGNKGYKEIHRLKWHLKTVHRLFHCPQCGQAGFDKDSLFKNDEDLEKHRENGQCQKRTLPQRNYSDGFYKDQSLKIEKRWKKQDSKAKWDMMYRILFPHCPAQIPDPYFQSRGELLIENARLQAVVRDMPLPNTGTHGDDIFSRAASQASAHPLSNNLAHSASSHGPALAYPSLYAVVPQRHEVAPGSYARPISSHDFWPVPTTSHIPGDAIYAH